jgi:hypothetical protein
MTLRKIFLNSRDWKAILLGVTGFPQMQVELYSIMKNLVSRSDVVIILTQGNNKPKMLLKYNENTDEFSEFSIGS